MSFVKLALMKRHRFHTGTVFKVDHALYLAYFRHWFAYTEAYTGHSVHNKHCIYFINSHYS